jgi:IclR family acetate operon transcriptional repressor
MGASKLIYPIPGPPCFDPFYDLILSMRSPAIQKNQTLTSPTPTSTVLQAFRLLDLFDGKHGELSLIELAHGLAKPKSTTHRLAADLVRAKALERTTRGYQLGMKLFEYGTQVPNQRRIREASMPFLQDLRELTNLTANLATRDGSEIVYIEKLVSRTTVVPHTRSGGRLPVHCTALGKALLAFAPSDEISAFLELPLARVTSHTIVESRLLRRELAEIRRSRLAFDNEESEMGLFCVAAPIVVRDKVVASISVTGATAQEHTRTVAPTVAAVARALTRSLGGE